MAWNYVGDNPVNFTDPTGAWELRDHVWSMIEATVCGAIGFANFYAGFWCSYAAVHAPQSGLNTTIGEAYYFTPGYAAGMGAY